MNTEQTEVNLLVVRAFDSLRIPLQWYRDGGGVSDRQWTDVLGVLKVQGPALDRAYLCEWASQLGLADLLDRAMDAAGLPPIPPGNAAPH